jgi:hypothetical protein
LFEPHTEVIRKGKAHKLSLSKTLSADTNPPIWKTVLRCFKQTWILDQLLAESQIGQCK